MVGGFVCCTKMRKLAIMEHCARNSSFESRNFAGTKVAANSYTDVTFTFTKKHATIPVVVATLTSRADTVTRANVNLSVYDKTTEGFKIRIYNASSAELNIEFNWIAMEL